MTRVSVISERSTETLLLAGGLNGPERFMAGTPQEAMPHSGGMAFGMKTLCQSRGSACGNNGFGMPLGAKL